MTILLIVTSLNTSTKTSKYHPRGNMAILKSDVVCSVRSTPPPSPLKGQSTSGAEPIHYSPWRRDVIESLMCKEFYTSLKKKTTNKILKSNILLLVVVCDQLQGIHFRPYQSSFVFFV